MITVKAVRTSDTVYLSIKGHALFHPGNDIVCAAASMLGTTFAKVVRDMERNDEVSAMSMEPIEPGRLEVYAVAVSSCREKLLCSLETIVTGFRLLEERYPKHVSLEEQSF